MKGQDLRDRGATDLRSALALVAGVDIAPGGDGGPAAAVPEMWGFREFDAFLLVVDGVPWGGAFNPDTATLSLQDVERIEILRGAAPVMYGATSFVGVIHVVHQAPGSGDAHVGAFAGTESSAGLAPRSTCHPGQDLIRVWRSTPTSTACPTTAPISSARTSHGATVAISAPAS